MASDFRNIAVSDFQTFVDTKYQEGYSPTSILKFHTVIHKCMKYAVIQGLLEHNLSGYVILPKRKRYIGRTFNLEQLGRFLEEARSSPAEPAFMLAAAYGLRRSEAAGLRWQCVDFSNGCITINHTAISSSGKVTYSDRVKTDSSYRTLPLMDGIREYLLRLRKEQQRSVSAPACRISVCMTCGIRQRPYCCSRAFRSSTSRNGWGMPILQRRRIPMRMWHTATKKRWRNSWISCCR